MPKKGCTHVLIRDVPTDVWNAFRIQCISDGITATAKLREMIKESLTEELIEPELIESLRVKG